MILTTHITVEYDDQTRRAAVYKRTCSSMVGCSEERALGPVVALELARGDLSSELHGLVAGILRDHAEVDSLPRSL